MDQSQPLPEFICGPLVRRLTENRLVLWWISPRPLKVRFKCFYSNETTPFLNLSLNYSNLKTFRFGKHAWVHLAEIRPKGGFATDRTLEYDLEIEDANNTLLTDLIPHIVYPNQKRPSFVVRKSIHRFFHGSCRKPHFDGEDTFVGLDKEIQSTLDDIEIRPALLVLTGDQVYADDVAGPMLQAIHRVIELLGIYEEEFEHAVVNNSRELYSSRHCYYERKKILPRTKIGNHWYRRGGAKHIFTSSFAHNHLITFAEWMAMYILVWSPVPWKFVSFDPQVSPAKFRDDYSKELAIINNFKERLPNVQRLLAHIPSYMIFDDHDISDDWNLTAKWEQQAYGHPLTKRIIGNGLIAYFLCQGWGNAPDSFDEEFLESVDYYATNPSKKTHDALVDSVLAFKHWHYEVSLHPKLIVVDSRTRRWRRDKLLASPSGLLDWEALMKLQHKMMKSDAVLLVTPAPIFGVKTIELIQRLFTYFGYSLAVDAENWMAHRKSAFTLLEIFKNAKTASYNVVISGDVHYSFAYDVELRYTKNCPGIWQITSSGIKNEFPGFLLRLLDAVNRIMYGPRSPFNWFTKRRDMVIYERLAKGQGKRRLISRAGIGRVTLDKKGAPIEIAEIYPNDPPLLFEPKKTRKK